MANKPGSISPFLLGKWKAKSQAKIETTFITVHSLPSPGGLMAQFTRKPYQTDRSGRRAPSPPSTCGKPPWGDTSISRQATFPPHSWEESPPGKRVRVGRGVCALSGSGGITTANVGVASALLTKPCHVHRLLFDSLSHLTLI